MALSVIFKMLTLNVLILVILFKFTWGQKISQYVVGGEDAVENEFPWAARLILRGNYTCGAVVIAPLWLLTAAHCVAGYDMEQYVVEAGSVNVHSPNMKRYSLTRIVVHPEFVYYGEYSDNDIAVLKTSVPLLANGVEPISMVATETNGEELQDNPMGVFAGWGFLSWGGALPDILQKVELPFLLDAQCAAIHGRRYTPMMMICAGTTQWKDLCTGDSGSGFLFEGVLRGIASWGDKPCGYGPNFATVFSHVQYFLGWINDVIATE